MSYFSGEPGVHAPTKKFMTILGFSERCFSYVTDVFDFSLFMAFPKSAAALCSRF